MGRIFWAGMMLAACSGSFADQAAVSEFERQARSLGESIDAQNSSQSVRCQELASQVEQLKGKPQRRYAARQDYMLECQREPALPPEPFSIDGNF